VQGRLRIEEYEKGRERRVSLSCIADHVIALRQPPKQRAAGPKQDGRALGIPDPELNDDLTW
jgi:hypothetical protein